MAPSLSDAHRRTLKETSGLTDAVIDARGYRTITTAEMVAMVDDGKFRKEVLKAGGWTGIPVRRPDSVQHCEIIRLDSTVAEFNKGARYVWPTGVRNAIDIAPLTAGHVRDSTVPLFFVEGIKKGDALSTWYGRGNSINYFCVASLNGIWGWRAKLDGIAVPNPDLYDIALTERQIILFFDSDYYLNDDVKAGVDKLAEYVSGKTEAKRVWICIPPSIGVRKQGADDYLLHDHTLDDLLSYCRTPKQADFSIAVPSLEVVTAKEVIDSSKDTVDWLVDKFIPDQSITVMAGHSRSYKTWHALRLSVDLISGTPYLEHPSMDILDPASVLYLNREMGRAMLGSRLRNITEHQYYSSMEDLPQYLEERFFFIDSAVFDINDETTQLYLIDFIREHNIKLIVLDTFSMVWHGDENSSQEVGTFYSILRKITYETGVSWLILHHLSKPVREAAGFDPLFALRGSGQMGQQADSVCVLTVSNTTAQENSVSVKFIHAKSRAAYELPEFYTSFISDPDSTVRHLIFDKLVRDDLATHAAAGDDEMLRNYMLTVMGNQASMRTDMGMPRPGFENLFKQSWPSDVKYPTQARINRMFKHLVDSQIVQVVDARANTIRLNRTYADQLESEEVSG